MGISNTFSFTLPVYATGITKQITSKNMCIDVLATSIFSIKQVTFFHLGSSICTSLFVFVAVISVVESGSVSSLGPYKFTLSSR